MQLEHLISKTLNEDSFKDDELAHPALDNLDDYYNTHKLLNAASHLGIDTSRFDLGSSADDHLTKAKETFEQNKENYPHTTWNNLVGHAKRKSSYNSDLLHDSVTKDVTEPEFNIYK